MYIFYYVFLSLLYSPSFYFSESQDTYIFIYIPNQNIFRNNSMYLFKFYISAYTLSSKRTLQLCASPRNNLPSRSTRYCLGRGVFPRLTEYIIYRWLIYYNYNYLYYLGTFISIFKV